MSIKTADLYIVHVCKGTETKNKLEAIEGDAMSIKPKIQKIIEYLDQWKPCTPFNNSLSVNLHLDVLVAKF